jgi:taurine dioxygenase
MKEHTVSASALASKVSLQRFNAPFGAEVIGVDASREFDAATVATLKDAIDRHLVIVLRAQQLTADDLVRFTASFGEVSESVAGAFLLDENRAVTVVSNIVDERGNNIGLSDAGPYWHTDGLYYREPHAYTLLYALEVPHQNGVPLGDTQFVSTGHAYDALPGEMKQKLEGLQALHSITKRYEGDRMKGSTRKTLTPEQKAQNPDRQHPVIRTHPHTGKKCIYVDETYTTGIVGMPESESRALLAELLEHCIQRQFYYRHQWRVGDLLLWDNCAVQHKSTFDYALPQRRLLYRTTVKGGVPY